MDHEAPHKIDENMWKNREHIEEIIFLLDRTHWPTTVRTSALLDFYASLHDPFFFLFEAKLYDGINWYNFYFCLKCL